MVLLGSVSFVGILSAAQMQSLFTTQQPEKVPSDLTNRAAVKPLTGGNQGPRSARYNLHWLPWSELQFAGLIGRPQATDVISLE